MLQFLARLAQTRFTWYAGWCKHALVARHLDGIRIRRELTTDADGAAMSNCQTRTIAALKKVYKQWSIHLKRVELTS